MVTNKKFNTPPAQTGGSTSVTLPGLDITDFKWVLAGTDPPNMQTGSIEDLYHEMSLQEYERKRPNEQESNQSREFDIPLESLLLKKPILVDAVFPSRGSLSTHKPSHEEEEFLLAPHPSNRDVEEIQATSCDMKDCDRELMEYRTKFGDMYCKFLETNNDVYLYRILVKSHVINRLSNCCNFNHLQATNKEELDEYLRGRIPNEARRIVKELSLYGLEISPKARKSIFQIVEKLYLTPPCNMYSSCISNSDEYNDILERFISRGINLDDDLRVPINFREMLIADEHLEVFYTGVHNELTLVGGRTSNGRRSGHMPRASYFAQLFVNLPNVPDRVIDELDLININGINYSKKALESITELDVNSLLANLNIESRIHEEPKHEEGESQEIEFL